MLAVVDEARVRAVDEQAAWGGWRTARSACSWPMPPRGSRALIDRELYLPQRWADDRDRCRAAGIGDEVMFATKPGLVQKMIGRAVQAGVPFSWVAADEVYGGNPGLCDWLEGEGIAYVMAVACSEPAATPAGRFRADELAALVPASGWQRLSCADGSKGPRLYDWALIGTAARGHQLLVRRSLSGPLRGLAGVPAIERSDGSR